jgi:CheY-specific phosphatase CheX
MEMQVLKTAMISSISEVLETMFFLPMDFKEDIKAAALWDAEKSGISAVRIEFKGPRAGVFIFTIPNQLAVSITSSFLGIDEEQAVGDHVTETIKEIVNMVAGNTFSKFDDQAVYNLGVPEPISFDDVKATQIDPENEIFIGIDTLDSWLSFQLVLQG